MTEWVIVGLDKRDDGWSNIFLNDPNKAVTFDENNDGFLDLLEFIAFARRQYPLFDEYPENIQRDVDLYLRVSRQ